MKTRDANPPRWQDELEEILSSALDDYDEAAECSTCATERSDSPLMQTFERSANETLDDVRPLYSHRGSTYGDTWALPNQKTTFTEYVLGLRRDPFYQQWLRLLQLAVLIDVKDSRIRGVNIDDSIMDGIAYRASFRSHLQDYLAGE